MAKNLLEGKLNKDKVQVTSLTPDQIEAMHKAMNASATIQEENPLSAPSNNSEKTKQKTKASLTAVAPEQGTLSEPITRLSIDVTKEMHKMMKMRVIESEQSIRDYVVTLIRKDLGFKS